MSTDNSSKPKKRLWERLGPGIITASVVLGPGSIMASSKAGASGGYHLLWLLLVAAFVMAVYTAMGARLGCALTESPLEYIAQKYGRALALLAGLSAFLVTAGFQAGNNMAVGHAVNGLVPSAIPMWVWPIVFTVLSILFLVWAKSVYKWLERGMMALVAIMILAFVGNLIFTGINPGAFVRGLVPTLREGDMLIAPAMIATNFSIVAAFYQPYLVKAKGWRREDLREAIGDAWTGIAILCGIIAVIMIVAAETLHGTDTELKDVGQLATVLESVLGPYATFVFSLGLAAAAFSSFIINALVGGSLLADGLGLDARLDSAPSRVLGCTVMVIGCAVAVVTSVYQVGMAQSILIAQASTLIAAPLSGILLLWLASKKSIMGDLKNSWWSIAIGIFGLCLIIGLALRTARGILGF